MNYRTRGQYARSLVFKLGNLTFSRFTLFETLVRHAGQVVSREDLTEKVLGEKSLLRSSDRRAREPSSQETWNLDTSERIKAVRNAGYLFVIRLEKG